MIVVGERNRGAYCEKDMALPLIVYGSFKLINAIIDIAILYVPMKSMHDVESRRVKKAWQSIIYTAGVATFLWLTIQVFGVHAKHGFDDGLRCPDELYLFSFWVCLLTWVLLGLMCCVGVAEAAADQ